MVKTRTNVSTLFYLSLFSFGSTLAGALQLSNYSNFFKILGVRATDLPWLWLIPPVTGLIIQPIIGQLSDDTATRIGKRMPYLLGWGILCVIAFLIFPFITSLLSALIIVLLMDCSINGSSEALRALTNDMVKEEELQTKALFLQGVFSGIGAALGTNLPYLIHQYFLHQEKFTPGVITNNLKYSFFIAAFILVIVLVLVFIKLKEKIIRHQYLSRKKETKAYGKRLVKVILDIYSNIRKLQIPFKKLCLMHATSWVGIFILWLYFSTFIAQTLYKIPLNPASNLHLYANAIGKASLDSSFYFSIYQYVSVVYALILFFLPRNVDIKLIHIVSLLVGGCSIMMLFVDKSPAQFIASFIGIGIMWGSMITIPYIVAMRLLPKGKAGIYLGIFNICITLPQLICGLTLPFIYGVLLQKNAAYIMLLSGIMILISAYLWFKNSYSTAFLPRLIRKDA